MCSTPYCDGSCEDCERQNNRNKEYEESNQSCPYKKCCKWETIDDKTDICTNCGLVTNY